MVDAFLNQRFCEWTLVSLETSGLTEDVKYTVPWVLFPEILMSLVWMSVLGMKFL